MEICSPVEGDVTGVPAYLVPPCILSGIPELARG